MTPRAVVSAAAFGNETVNVGIPFEITAKGMKNHNKTRSKIHGFI